MRKLLLLSFTAFIPMLVSGQYLRIGDGSFGGTVAGPLIASSSNANFTSRFAYIYPASLLTKLEHGDSITALEIGRIAGNGFNNNCNLKIYFKNTSQSDFGTGKLYWPGEVTGAVSVYDQNPRLEIGTNDGFHKIPFYNNTYRYDTTNGKNLEILVEYVQTSTQASSFFWYFEDGSTLNAFATNQTKFYSGVSSNDSLPNSTDRHPTINLIFPRFDNDVMLMKVYTLGKLPVPLGNPDSVQALVRNVGKKAVSTGKVQTWIVGPNHIERDSGSFSIGLNEEKYIQIPSLKPARKGLDTVFVAIQGDKNSSNDTGFSYRLANENIYSYRDITLPPDAGGIGFNGSTGDFVARFFASKKKNINQVTVNFALSGRPFKVGIWESKSNNRPGKLLYLSDSLITVGGNYILDLKKAVSVNGSFFVGVRQLNTSNVAFGYQTESPVRPNTFYYAAPQGDTNWIDFYPDAPFKFLIEPRLQGDTDLTALSADYPKDSLDMYVTDTMAPKGTIGNIGLKDIRDSFDIVCEILQFGKSYYKEVLRDTLSAGQKRTYTFPKTFYPKNFGEYVLMIYCKHPYDQIKDNDTVIRKFYVGLKKDIINQSVYEPSNNAIFEYLRDTFMPVAAVQNIGYDNSVNFIARCLIKKGNTVLYNRIQNLSLPKFQSKILNWPTYKTLDTGKLDVFFIVEMPGDKNRKNDTAKRTVFVLKSFDPGLDSVLVPDKNVFYLPGKPIKPSAKVFNDGVLNVYNAKLSYRITSAYTPNVYRDSILINFGPKESFKVNFIKSFTPPKRGIYTMMMRIDHPSDLVHTKDSMVFDFFVGNPYDYSAVSVLYPKATDTLSSGGGPYAPKVRIKNAGFIKNTDIVPMVCQIWWNNIKVYQDIKSTNLDTSVMFDLDFANSFNPMNAGKYQVIAYTNYVSDVFKKNDTALGSFVVTIGRDAHVVSIDTPLNADKYSARSSAIKIKGTIENTGKLKMSSVQLFAEIYHGNKLEYYQSIQDSLKPYEVKKLAFGQSFTPKDSGTYKILMRTFSLQDQNIYNDTSIGYFFVDKGKDMAAVEWINPPTASVFLHTTGPAAPRFRIRNVGMDTNKLSGKLYLNFFDSAKLTTVFSDTVSFTDVAMGASDTITANKTFNFLTPGLYRSYAQVSAVGDNFPENDTLQSLFRVVLNGVRALQGTDIKVYPNPASGILYIQSTLPIQQSALYDISGKLVLMRTDNPKMLNVQGLKPGAYLLRIYALNGVYSTPVVVE